MKSKDLASNIGRAFQKAAEGSSELASLQIKQLDETGDLVTGLQTSLQQTQEIHITDLLLLLAQMHDHVVSILLLDTVIRTDAKSSSEPPMIS